MITSNPAIQSFLKNTGVKESHPCQGGIGHSQDSLPVDSEQEEAIRRQNGSNVNSDGSIWAFGDGDVVDA